MEYKVINPGRKEEFAKSLQELFNQTEKLLDKEYPFDEEINFKISDILDPISLNNIKKDPKYCFQKFKIYFSKFFSLEEYFFKMEEKVIEEVEIKQENKDKEDNNIDNEKKKKDGKNKEAIKDESKEIKNNYFKNEKKAEKEDDKKNEIKEINEKEGNLSKANKIEENNKKKKSVKENEKTKKEYKEIGKKQNKNEINEYLKEEEEKKEPNKQTEEDKKEEKVRKENEKIKEENKEKKNIQKDDIKEKGRIQEENKDEINDKSKVNRESKKDIKRNYKISTLFEKPKSQLISKKIRTSKKSLQGKDSYSKNKGNGSQSTKNKPLIEFDLIKNLNSQNIIKQIFSNKSYSFIYNIRKNKNELSLNSFKSKKKESLNSSGSNINNNNLVNNKNDSTSSFQSSRSIKSNSLSYLEKQALIAMGYGNDVQKKKEEEKFPDYKLKLIKSNLNLEENDEMSGKSYEDYARKIFKIMCIIATNKEVFFENPNKIIYEKIIDFYLQNFFRYSFNIKTPIKKVLYNNIQEGNEIDIVYHLKYGELIKIANKFQNYFLINNIKKDENIIQNIIDVEDTDEITFICEIAKNIVKQGKEKLEQILNYIKIISIMNTISKSNIVNTIEYKELCYDYRCSPKTEKLFCIITDGDYKILKITINFIKNILKSSLTQLDIKAKIDDFINSEKDLFYNETNPESLKDNIYCTYLILANLTENNIKHAIIYIGDITKINYEDIYNNILNKGMNNTNETLTKETFPKLKQNYVKLKQIIKEFEKKVSDVTTIKTKIMDIIFQELKNTINNIIMSPESELMNKLLKHIKFDGFLFIVKKDDKENNSIYDSIMNSSAIKNLKFFFKLKCSMLTPKESEELIEKVEECPEQYGKKPIFLLYEANYYLDTGGNIYLPKVIIQGFYMKKKHAQKANVGFLLKFKSLNNLPFLITVNRIIDKKMKDIKKNFDKEVLLQKKNLPKKIINDFNHLFQQNEKNYSFIDMIAKMEFNYGKINLINYHDMALTLLEEINGKLDKEIRKKIMENTKLKINELIDNVLCFNIYTIIFKKISEILTEKIQEKIQNSLKDYNTTAYKMLNSKKG